MKSLVIYFVPLLIALAAVEMIVVKIMKKPFYRFHDTVTSMNIGSISETIRILAKLMSIVVYALMVNKVAAFEWDIRSPYVWIVSFFMYDFFYYWAHRSGHEINLLWASHVVHHSSEEFNLSTAMRQSWTNQFFYWMFYLPMAIVGIPVKVFAITALASALYQFLVHTRLVSKLGWFEWVFCTPSHHRVHHGRNPYCIDKNYGGTLIVWDRLFGTFAAERENEPIQYGTLTPLNSWNPVWANFKNFRDIFCDVSQAKGLKNKLMMVFAPPDWVSQRKSAVLEKKDNIQKYETPKSAWQIIYGVMGGVIIFSMTTDLLLSAPEMKMSVQLLYTLIPVISTATLAYLFEGRQWAIVLESIRSLLVLGSLSMGVWFHVLPSWVQPVGAVMLVISLMVLAMLYRENNMTIRSLRGASA